MNNEEFVETVGNILSNAKSDLSERLASAVEERIQQEKLFDEKSLTKIIEDSDIVRRLVRKHIESWVATEVGNRLRCGIYDGSTVDRVFDSIWTEQFDVAIKDRIRAKVYSAIDSAISERLRQMRS